MSQVSLGQGRMHPGAAASEGSGSLKGREAPRDHPKIDVYVVPYRADRWRTTAAVCSIVQKYRTKQREKEAGHGSLKNDRCWLRVVVAKGGRGKHSTRGFGARWGAVSHKEQTARRTRKRGQRKGTLEHDGRKEFRGSKD